MGMGMGKWMGTGRDGEEDRDGEWEWEREREREEAFNHFFVLFMSQILYVPCKCNGDVYVAIKKRTLQM